MPEVKIEALTEIPGPRTYEDLSKALELPALGAELTEEQVRGACDLARTCALGAIIVRPSDLDLASRWVNPPLVLGAAIDWPHGYSTTAVKQYAARDALRRGARELTVAINTGKLVSRQFQYLEMELLQIAEACHEISGKLIVNLESSHLTEEHKIVACRIAKRAGADLLATSQPLDLPLLRQHARDRIQLKLRDVSTLDAALEALAAGCTRLETAQPAGILEAWKARISPKAPAQNA